MRTRTLFLYIPKWLFPSNLGDSIATTFLPKVIKDKYPDSKLEVISYGDLIDVFQRCPEVDISRGPKIDEKQTEAFWVKQAIASNRSDGIFSVYPIWHPLIFKLWAQYHDHFVKHPTANLITVNFLLQINAIEYLFKDFDLLPNLYIETYKNDYSEEKSFQLGIVPATKLSGRPTPHPNCDGVGYRYKLEYWEIFVKLIKNKYANKVLIYEFAEKSLGLGDYNIGQTASLTDLIREVDKINLGVLSDGGIHWAFIARNKPAILFTGTLINKAEFFKMGNAFYPEHLHLPCRFQCPSYFLEVRGGEDLSKKCNRECENLNPESLAEYTSKIIDELS